MLSLNRTIQIGWLVLGVITGVMLLRPAAELPGDASGLRRFPTPEIESELRLSQTFRMPVDGLHGIEFQPVQSGTPANGRVELALIDETGSEPRLVRTAEIDGALAVRMPSLQWEFSPIPDSRGRWYRVEISSRTKGRTGVRLWATKGERYEYGRMFVNETWRWADLSFQAKAPVTSVFRALVDPSNGSRGIAVLGALLLIWILVGVLLHFVSLDDPSDAAIARLPSQ